MRECDGVIAWPPGAKIRPRSNAGVCARVPLARATVFSARMAWTLSQVAAIDDRLVLAGIARALVHRLAEVDAVVEDLVDRALVDRLARPMLAVLRRPGFRGVAGAPEFLRQLGRRADAQEPLEDQPDELGLRLVHHQLAVATS